MIFFNKIWETIISGPAKRDKIIIINLILSLLINLVLWAVLIFNFWLLPEYIVLRYNIYFGINSLGPWYIIFLLPLFGVLVLAINYWLSFYFYLKEKILSYFLSFAAFIFNLLMLLAGWLLILVNL